MLKPYANVANQESLDKFYLLKLTHYTMEKLNEHKIIKRLRLVFKRLNRAGKMGGSVCKALLARAGP